MADAGEARAASGDGRGDPDEIEELRRRISELTASHEREIAGFQRMLDERERPVRVHVTTGPPTRLKVFTGLPPTGGNEVTFPVWEQQVMQYLRDPEPNEEERDKRILASLQGLAREQTLRCRTGWDALLALRHLFGNMKTSDELYIDFCKLSPRRDETVTAFLSRMWAEMLKVQEAACFGDSEAKRKYYRAVHAELTSAHPLLTLEMRNQLGLPGSASPGFADLYRIARAYEASSSASTHKVTTRTHLQTAAPQKTEPEMVGAIVKGVGEQLNQLLSSLTQAVCQLVPPPSSGVPPQNPVRPPPPPRAPRGHCFNCGEMNAHFARNCPNAPNPERVAQVEERRRRLRRQQGGSASTLYASQPGLNGQGSLR